VTTMLLSVVFAWWEVDESDEARKVLRLAPPLLSKGHSGPYTVWLSRA